MSDLNVAIILSLVDRMSGPAQAAARALGGIAQESGAVAGAAGGMAAATDKASVAQQGLAGASAAAAAATTAAAAAAEVAGAQAQAMGRAAEAAAAQTAALNRAAENASINQALLGRTSEATGRQVETAAEKMTLLARGQHMAASASASLRTHADQLNESLTKLAFADIAVQGLDRAGRAINEPLKNAVERQAEFQRGITGIGIVADLPKAQLPGVAANIVDQAQRLALPISTVLQDDMAVLNEGVYRGVAQLKAASRSAASLSLLADVSGSPVGPNEAGALISTYAHSLSIPAEQLDHYNAMLFRGSQLGGDKIGDVARFLPAVTAQLKGRAFGNERGFVDAVAAFQIVKRVSGDDESAGIDLKDFLAGINNAHTKKRFAKQGIDIDAAIVAAEQRGVSPIESVIGAIRSKIGDDPNDPRLVSKLGNFFVNQQAAQAALALLQYQKDGSQGLGFDSLRAQIASPDAQTRYAAAIAAASQGPAAALQRQANAGDAARIAAGGALAPVTQAKSDVLQRVYGGVAGVFQGPAGQALAVGASAVGGVAAGAAGVGNAIVGVLAPMLIFKQLTGKLLPDVLKLFGGKALGLAGGVLEAVGGAFAAATGPALAFAAALLANPITWIVLGVVALAGAAYLIVKNWGPISKWFAGVWAQIKASGAGAIAWFTGLPATFARIGGDILRGLARGIASGLGVARDAIEHAGGAVIGWFKSKLGIRSPSIVFHGLGLDTMAGLSGGLRAGSRDPVAHVGRVAARITAAMAVAASAHPAAAQTIGANAGATPAAAHPAGGRTTHVRLEQHFHLDGRTDIRALARELQRHQAAGLRAALHDGGDDL